jgi:phosphatidylglycerophosphate synthase
MAGSPGGRSADGLRPKRGALYVENFSTTGWEPWIVKHICEPIVRHIPASITPNSISVVNHLVAWAVFFLAALAPYLSPASALLARLVAAAGVFCSLLLDCLDGMHARRTGQGSRLGEVVDHWLDALNVPLMGAGMILTLKLDPLTTAVAMVTCTTPYNGQLVLYHHTGRFVHPTTSGVDGQVMLCAAYVAFGFLFRFVPQDLYWVRVGVTCFSWLVIALNVKLGYFYLVRLKGILVPHLMCITFCAGYAALFVLDMMSAPVFVLGIAAISFRLTGSYVLYSVLEQPYGGIDWRIVAWMPAIVAEHLWFEPYQIKGVTMQIAPLLFFLHLCGQNLLDFARQIPSLRPSEGKQTFRP